MNKKIVISGIAIMIFGLVDSIQKGSNTQMKVFQGTLVLMLLLSMADAIDERLGKVAGSIAIVALIGATLAFFAPGKSTIRDINGIFGTSPTTGVAVYRDKKDLK